MDEKFIINLKEALGENKICMVYVKQGLVCFGEISVPNQGDQDFLKHCQLIKQVIDA